jgi:hypothetical protein
MIEITERTQAIWYVQGKQMDWLACIESAEEEGRFKLTYRFRYYVDKKAWDSEDRKSWYEMTAADMAKGIETVRMLAEVIKMRAKAEGAGEMWELLRGTGSMKSFMAQFAALPFAHMKQLTKAEYEAEYGGKCVLEK